MSIQEFPILEGGGRRQDNQFRFLLDIVLSHWLSIAVCTATAAIIGFGAGWYLQDESYEYRAHATLVVRPSLYDNALLQGLSSAPSRPLTPKAIKDQTSVQGLADDIARALVQEDIANGGQDAGLTSQPELAARAEKIAGQVELIDMNESAQLRVQMKAATSAEAQRLTDLAVRILIAQSKNNVLSEQRELHDGVQRELDKLLADLQEAESRQWQYREETGFQTHGQVWADIEEKNKELREIQLRRPELQARIEEMEVALARNEQELPQTLVTISENAVGSLKDDLDDLIKEKAELLVDWTPGSPPIVDIEELILAKRDAIMRSIDELGAGSGEGGGSWEERKGLYAKKAEFEFELADVDIREATLNRLIDDFKNQLPVLADKRFEYDRLEQETENIRHQVSLMIEKEFELKMAQSRAGGGLERRDSVVADRVAFGGGGLSIATTTGIGAIIGFLAAFSWAMMREVNDTSIRTLQDATDALGLEILGTIPRMKFASSRRSRRRRRGAYIVATDEAEIDACIVTRHDPKSPISEAYRSLRTNFQFATIQEKPRTVMVTSAVPGEGKTTTAVNFAVTMADQGLRVLVVDTDLRRPWVHRVLKMQRGAGLADVLRGDAEMNDVIRPSQVKNLWMISSGHVPANPSELMGSERMRQIVDRLGKMFDLVVCDAPSLHVVTDPVLLATHIDTVLLVLAVGRTRRDTIVRAKKFLEAANPHIAGVVLNGLEASRRHYYYYYYYYQDEKASA